MAAARGLPLAFAWLKIARIVWLVLVVLVVVTLIATLQPYDQLVRTVCAAPQCPYDQLTPAGLETLRQQNLTLEFYAGYMQAIHLVTVVGNILIGLWIIVRLPRDWMALLASLLFILTGVPSRVDNGQSALPFISNILFFFTSLQAYLLILFLLLYPDGRFAPAWIGRVFAAWAIVNVPRLWPDSPLNPALYPAVDTFLWLGILFLALGSQIYRYRRLATPLQRQQLKWVLYTLAVFLILGLFFDLNEPPSGSLVFMVSQGMNTVFSLAFPLTVANAILRHHLWDIDVVIRKTLVYTLLTTGLVLVFFGSIVLLQSIFLAFTGSPRSDFGNAISTLVIAALFTPLRRRIQNVIDRRFFRQKFDAERTLADLRPVLQEEVEVEKLQQNVIGAVEKAFQPATSSIWIRSAARQERT